MKSDGYILTPELLQWKYFHRPVVVQVLIHVLLASTHNEASSVTLSYRDLAQQLHTTVKTIRVAIDTLIAEHIITKCSAPRASTMVYINSSHPLSHCIIPWQNDVRAQDRAQIGAHSRAQRKPRQTPASQIVLVGQPLGKGTDGAHQRAQQKTRAQATAQIGAQINTPQTSINQEDAEQSATTKGTDGAHQRAQQKTRAQATAQIGAQINTPQTSINQEDAEQSATTKGTSKGTDKGTLARKGKKETKETKEKLSPEPPIKERKERKERRQKRAPTPTQKKEKEKKLHDADAQYSEVLRLFNRLFLGTKVKPISKMTPDRKKMVAKFISDYSFSDIEPMLRKALDSDLLSGRKDGGSYISFNWIFNPENYEQLMEGTFDNPTIEASAGRKSSAKSQAAQSQATMSPAPPQPQHEETSEEIEARLQQKEEAKQAKEKAETEALRQKYYDWIAKAAENPNGSMARMVRQAYDNGTLAQLGIVWNPTVAEEEQSLADLDDQTQSYLQSILSD